MELCRHDRQLLKGDRDPERAENAGTDERCQAVGLVAPEVAIPDELAGRVKQIFGVGGAPPEHHQLAFGGGESIAKPDRVLLDVGTSAVGGR